MSEGMKGISGVIERTTVISARVKADDFIFIGIRTCYIACGKSPTVLCRLPSAL